MALPVSWKWEGRGANRLQHLLWLWLILSKYCWICLVEAYYGLCTIGCFTNLEGVHCRWNFFWTYRTFSVWHCWLQSNWTLSRFFSCTWTNMCQRPWNTSNFLFVFAFLGHWPLKRNLVQQGTQLENFPKKLSPPQHLICYGGICSWVIKRSCYSIFKYTARS